MSAKWTLGELRQIVDEGLKDEALEVIKYLVERGARVVAWDDERQLCECGKAMFLPPVTACDECNERAEYDREVAAS